MVAVPTLLALLVSLGQRTYPECTGIMAMRSPSGSPHGPWVGPTLLYAPYPPNPTEWYSQYGINNPTILVLPNGTTLLGGRTCSRTEHPWIATAAAWNGTYKSIDNNSQPYTQNNAEDPFMWTDSRGHFHQIHHWQSGNRNRCFNGGHSFSRDGVRWTFSKTTAYTKNISWSTPAANG
eukprot:gene1375-18029_t